MSSRAALVALILAYLTCRTICFASFVCALVFLIIYAVTGQPQQGYAAIVCLGSMVAFAVVGTLAKHWARE